MEKIYPVLALWNIIVMFIFGVDKLCAKKRVRRIKEKILLFCTFLFGALGGMFGMIIFNHKTSKMKFRILVPLFVFVNIFLFGLLRTYF